MGHNFSDLQLRGCVTSNSDYFPLCPPMSLLVAIFKCKIDTKQTMSRIYTLLNTYHVTSLESLKHLEECISEPVWQRNHMENLDLLSMPQTYCSQFKIVHGLHWSKNRPSKIKTDLDPTYDRCKQALATLLHMFWTCPKLYRFWHPFLRPFPEYVTVRETVHPSPLISLFGVVPVDASLSAFNINMTGLCSLLARRLILYKWKESLPPTYGHWIREVMCHIHPEKIRYTIRDSVGKFFATRQPLISFVDSMAATNITV